MEPQSSTQLNTLIDQIKTEYRETASYTGLSRLDTRVEQALRSVPRPEFVPERDRRYAYGNYPLPIGHNQTISQPYIVALMTDLLSLDSYSKVLEIGTGCGYQTAVLANIAREVYSIEIVQELSAIAADHLRELNYTNVHLRIGDGYGGWPESAPYDAIMVTACAEEVPPPLLAQLGSGGRMIIPLQTSYYQQELFLVFRDEYDELQRRSILPVRFVPFIRAI